jgi:hypothetical protein
VAIFLLYLVVPDAGLGGSDAKIRFSWGAFIVGGILMCSVAGL